MKKKPRWKVTLITEKTIIVIADEYEEALEKAELKMGLKWSAETAYELDENDN